MSQSSDSSELLSYTLSHCEDSGDSWIREKDEVDDSSMVEGSDSEAEGGKVVGFQEQMKRAAIWVHASTSGLDMASEMVEESSEEGGEVVKEKPLEEDDESVMDDRSEEGEGEGGSVEKKGKGKALVGRRKQPELVEKGEGGSVEKKAGKGKALVGRRKKPEMVEKGEKKGRIRKKMLCRMCGKSVTHLKRHRRQVHPKTKTTKNSISKSGYVIRRCPVAGCGLVTDRLRDHLKKKHKFAVGAELKMWQEAGLAVRDAANENDDTDSSTDSQVLTLVLSPDSSPVKDNSACKYKQSFSLSLSLINEVRRISTTRPCIPYLVIYSDRTICDMAMV
jgi:hypothetical protein